MTHSDTTESKIRPITVLSMIGAALLLVGGEHASDAVRTSLHHCAAVIVPSLFPYTVLATLLLSVGTLSCSGKRTEGVMRRLFRLPGCALGTVLLGALCGFPVGAKIACDLTVQGKLTRKECARLIPLASVAGPAFTVEVVGAHAWGSRRLGILLYLAQIVLAVLLAVLFTPRKDGKEVVACSSPQSQSTDLFTTLASAISDAALATLRVCGFIVFFSVILRLTGDVLSALSLSQLSVPLAALLECTAGTAGGASLGGTWGAFLSGFSLGFCGVSVLSQVRMFAARCGVSLRPLLVQKLLSGVLLGILTAALVPRLSPEAAMLPCLALTDPLPTWILPAEILILILSCLFPLLPRHMAKKT